MPVARIAPDLPPPAFTHAVLDWYDVAGRSIPFRGVRDPFALLVSEVMAQQTQVERAAQAWRRFMRRFPTVRALADASPAAAVRAWSGLGYNRRAVRLQLAARIIVAEHGGAIPSEPAELERLPGVGPYTARAVAAIAFGRQVGAVDTNVRRVLGRVAWGDTATPSPAALQDLADALVPVDRPADWAHGLMDIGAGPCRGARPRCDACPVAAFCRFAAERPTREPPPSPRRRRADGPTTQRSFRSSRRWLRGRLVARMAEAGAGRWLTFDILGDHDRAAVDDALARLARDGLAELHPRRATTARLPGRQD